MLSHRFAIGHPPQNSRNTTNPPNGVTARGVSRNSTFSRPKSDNFPVHCFVLLGVSFSQLNLTELGQNSAIQFGIQA